MKKALAIINPISGISSKGSIPELLADAFRDTDIQLFLTYTKEGGHAYDLARTAVDHGYYMVIAVGGDGTVNEVAKALLYSSAILGIVPKGSGNGLARALNLSMNEGRAIEQLVKGRVRTIDCCKANEHPFFCTCGMGFDAEVSAKFAESPFRGPIAYVKTAIEKFISYTPGYYDVEFNDQKLKKEAFLIAAANANQYGNNAYIAPNASMEDGVMDLVIMKPFHDIRAAQMALQLFTKQLDKSSNTEIYQTKKVTICREKDGVVHLDGDAVNMGKKIIIEVLPRSIKVVAPA
ncbi:diacylglycerol kinase family protein [Porphyromonas pogonae]|uniref:diacylglycerol/lipid kinase family protein n=1 Tax=Porphyromonas pogonae TaxID=867595 RepID=UPI002E798A69|nr:diacylglycerol kinase family protein [Porphyromonas pogonae]